MIVVEVGVKTECKIYGAAPHKKIIKMTCFLGAKQFNMFKIDCRTSQYFWIQSLI
jgi:hypothetical protein